MAAKVVALSLPRYARELVRELEERTGRGFQLGIQEDLGRDFQVHLAMEEGEQHQVLADAAYQDHLPHFLVRGALLLLRLGAIPAEERLYPVGWRGESIGEYHERDLRARLPGMPGRVLGELSRALYEDLVHQAVTTPPILRVEREIAETLPDHWPRQRAYLARHLEDLEVLVGPAASEVLPSGIFRAYAGIGLAGAAEAAELTGRELGPLLQAHPYGQLGKRMREALLGARPPGYRGDRRIIDAWAKELRLEGWFQWVPVGTLSE